MVDQSQLNGLVTFIRYVSPEDLLKVFQSTDLFISCSEAENFGVAIVEAMACGIPVISTRSGGPEEYIDTKSGLLVPRNDAKAFAIAIQNAISMRTDFYSDYIRKAIQERFDFHIIGPQITKVYSHVLTTT
jgi:glycosyltransferase involved in cell wall biosynthesis